MLKSIGMLSLCMALVFVFSTASFAKTKATASNELLVQMKAKLMKEGLTIKDSQGNKHFINYTKIKTACATTNSIEEGGFFSCLGNSIALLAEWAVWQVACSGGGGGSFCQSLGNSITGRLLYDFFECGWVTLKMNKNDKKNDKSVYARNMDMNIDNRNVSQSSGEFVTSIR
jgi:hypothetical protein